MENKLIFLPIRAEINFCFARKQLFVAISKYTAHWHLPSWHLMQNMGLMNTLAAKFLLKSGKVLEQIEFSL